MSSPVLALRIIDLTLQLPRNPARPYLRRDLERLQYLVIHHTAGPASQTPQELARFHLSRGWRGIGYHYLVYATGEVFKVRPVSTIPACVDGSNTASVCVALVGDFTQLPPAPDAYDAAVLLVLQLRGVYPQLQVRGHREMPHQATACPGQAFPMALFLADVGGPAGVA